MRRRIIHFHIWPKCVLFFSHSLFFPSFGSSGFSLIQYAVCGICEFKVSSIFSHRSVGMRADEEVKHAACGKRMLEA